MKDKPVFRDDMDRYIVTPPKALAISSEIARELKIISVTLNLMRAKASTSEKHVQKVSGWKVSNSETIRKFHETFVVRFGQEPEYYMRALGSFNSFMRISYEDALYPSLINSSSKQKEEKIRKEKERRNTKSP